MASLSKELSELLKSPGGWFFFSNAVLYTQTNPLIIFLFLGALVFQRLAYHTTKSKQQGAFLSLIAGTQGLLAVNAIMTLASALTTAVIGTPELAISGLTFGVANLTQSVVYSRSSDQRAAKNFVLVMCEFLIAIGLAMIAVNAGYSIHVSFGLVTPVVIAGTIRCFRPQWLPSGFAYADMMFLSLMTLLQAIGSGNLANAVSRVLVVFRPVPAGGFACKK